MTKLRRPAGKYGEDEDDANRPAVNRRVPSTVCYRRESSHRLPSTICCERQYGELSPLSLPSKLPLYPDEEDGPLEYCDKNKRRGGESERIQDKYLNSGNWENVLLAVTFREYVAECSFKGEEVVRPEQTSETSNVKTRNLTKKKSKKQKKKDFTSPSLISSSGRSLKAKKKTKNKSKSKVNAKSKKNLSKKENSKSKKQRKARTNTDSKPRKHYRDIQVDPLIESSADLKRYSNSSKEMLSFYFSDCDASISIEQTQSASAKYIHNSPGTLETQPSSFGSLLTSSRTSETKGMTIKSSVSKIKRNNDLRPNCGSKKSTAQTKIEASARKQEQKGSILIRAWKAASLVVFRYKN